ncbi:MAG: TonB family protein [Smithellaceae bacterium]|nr:TonB family protein [Smithellaceae bacterium]
MTGRRLILSVLISIFLHALVVSLLGMVQVRPAGKMDSVLIVDLMETPGEVKDHESGTTEKNSGPPPRKVREGEATGLSIKQKIGQTSYRTYIRQVKEKILLRWNHPPEVQQGKLRGITVIRFMINRSGNLIKTSVERSSGSDHLDRHSLRAVEESAPYGAMPADLDLATLQVVARFRYTND